MTDSDLLRKFVDDRDEDAFAQIVDRHIDMVYAAANRQLAGSSHADDVTQAVFIVLAKKAAKVNGFTLAGWLVNAARLLAKQSIREEWRRKQREQQAAIMKAESYRPEEWQRVGPIVDEALSRLGQKDRTAVTLRYLEGREVAEIAASMGVSEAAAAKRLSRAWPNCVACLLGAASRCRRCPSAKASCGTGVPQPLRGWPDRPSRRRWGKAFPWQSALVALRRLLPWRTPRLVRQYSRNRRCGPTP